MSRVRDVTGRLAVGAGCADAQLELVAAAGGLDRGHELIDGAGSVGGVAAVQELGEVGRGVVQLGRDDVPAADSLALVGGALDVAGCPARQSVRGEQGDQPTQRDAS